MAIDCGSSDVFSCCFWLLWLLFCLCFTTDELLAHHDRQKHTIGLASFLLAALMYIVASIAPLELLAGMNTLQDSTHGLPWYVPFFLQLSFHQYIYLSVACWFVVVEMYTKVIVCINKSEFLVSFKKIVFTQLEPCSPFWKDQRLASYPTTQWRVLYKIAVAIVLNTVYLP